MQQFSSINRISLVIWINSLPSTLLPPFFRFAPLVFAKPYDAGPTWFLSEFLKQTFCLTIRIDRNLNKIQIGIPFHVLQIKNQLNHLIVIGSSWTLFFVWASTCNQFTNYISIIHYERGLKLILNIRIRISTPTNKEVPTEAHVYLPNISKPLLYSLPKHQRGENSKLSLICTGRP